MFILYFKYSGLALRWLLGMVYNTLHIKPVLPKILGLVGELLVGYIGFKINLCYLEFQVSWVNF